MHLKRLLAELGIPRNYGRQPFRPRFSEAQVLDPVEPNILGRMQRLAPETARAWRVLRDAARADGVELMLVSGFRSITDQAALIRKKLDAGQAIETILTVNAAPGFSQHHTGRAVDIATPGSRPLTQDFEHTPAFSWLRANAAAHGFRLSYDRGNVYEFDYEPWHWSQLT
jgi:zinc D-Ala-D-Ala carboxypeptidase